MINLNELEIACYLYNKFTNYDAEYLKLRDKGVINFSDERKITSLIEWLRKWGCRQFRKRDKEGSIKSLQDWYNSNKLNLPDNELHIIDYNFDKNEKIKKCFNNLMEQTASFRDNKRSKTKVRIGPVGAAKILFAIRPHFFAPWDTSIYKGLGFSGDGEGYMQYLKKIQKVLKNLKNECIKKGIKWDNLFKRLNKKHNSYPKLIDEYYWVSITNKCKSSEIIDILINNT